VSSGGANGGGGGGSLSLDARHAASMSQQGWRGGGCLNEGGSHALKRLASGKTPTTHISGPLPEMTRDRAGERRLPAPRAVRRPGDPTIDGVTTQWQVARGMSLQVSRTLDWSRRELAAERCFASGGLTACSLRVVLRWEGRCPGLHFGRCGFPCCARKNV